jgi:hypothetical protein
VQNGCGYLQQIAYGMSQWFLMADAFAQYGI